MLLDLWQQCINILGDELPSQQFNTWIRPLQVDVNNDGLIIYAPNRFVLDWVNENIFLVYKNLLLNVQLMHLLI